MKSTFAVQESRKMNEKERKEHIDAVAAYNNHTPNICELIYNDDHNEKSRKRKIADFNNNLEESIKKKSKSKKQQ